MKTRMTSKGGAARGVRQPAAGRMCYAFGVGAPNATKIGLEPCLGFNTEGVVELSPGLPKRAKASLGYPGLPRSGKMREPWTMPAPEASRSALPQHRGPLALLGRGASSERDPQPCHEFARPRGARKPRVGLASLGQPWAQFHNTFGVKHQLTPALAGQPWAGRNAFGVGDESTPPVQAQPPASRFRAQQRPTARLNAPSFAHRCHLAR